mgnify:CR=1 FL=1
MKILNKGKKITESDILLFETNNNIKLPNDFKKFLLKYNGGNPKPNKFLFQTKYGENREDIIEFYCLNKITDDGDGDNVYIPEGTFVIGENSNSDLILIALNKENYGKIYFWEINTGETFFVNESFDKFYSSLHEFIYRNKLDFEEYCSNREFDKAIELVKNGLDINTKNEYGHSLIQIATKKGSLELVKLLIDKGANKNGLLAISITNIDILKFLLNLGIDINEISEFMYNETALMNACSSSYGGFDSIKFLIENGANPKILDEKGKTATDYAKQNMEKYYDIKEYKEIYDLLKEKEKNFQ